MATQHIATAAFRAIARTGETERLWDSNLTKSDPDSNNGGATLAATCAAEKQPKAPESNALAQLELFSSQGLISP